METSFDKRKEHILVCLSSSPSNPRIVRTAAGMAEAFGASFTALYVQDPGRKQLSEEDSRRLKYSTELAASLGAEIATVYGDDVSMQIAEYARLSGITRIVIGRSSASRSAFFMKPSLTEKLIELAPDVDIHIIPDTFYFSGYREKQKSFSMPEMPGTKDVVITVLLLLVSTLLGFALSGLGLTEANIITVYILGVLLTSVLTGGIICSIASSVLSVLLFNFFFTDPRFTFRVADPAFVVTFAVMLAASVISGTLAYRLKAQASASAKSAFRTQVLLETDQMLQRADSEPEMAKITISQLKKLLGRGVSFYMPDEDGVLKPVNFDPDINDSMAGLMTPKEAEAAEWCFRNMKSAGSGTENHPDCQAVYYPVAINSKAYGAAGIYSGDKKPDSFENSIVISILGECALAMENIRNAREKELTAVLARNEQLRANLLRTISHDLRTPLTSISGNASTLLDSYDVLDDETRERIFRDIFDDAEWLRDLVENILAISRIEEGTLKIRTSLQLVDEVVEEALTHISSKASEHIIRTDLGDEMLMAEMDPNLIMQVIINIVNNAVKYTQKGSEITVSAAREGDKVRIDISDNGPGIPDDMKEHAFEMFYTGPSRAADGMRSLGLGLALCRSIMAAHGSTITLKDNVPAGCIFSFCLPLGEVKVNE